MRIRILRIIISVSFLVVAATLFFVQAIKGKYYYSLSVNNRIRVVPLEGRRGMIFDRNGQILVDNRLSFNVAVIPQDLQNSEELFQYLSETLKVDKKELLQSFYQRRTAPFAPVVIAEDVDKSLAINLEENKFRFPGLYVQETFRRNYPMESIGAHVLGYVGKISAARIKQFSEYGYSPLTYVGYTGMEEYYDKYLMGEDGGQQIEVDSRGRQVRLLSVRKPRRGKDIHLTVDARIQQAAVRALGENHGSIVVMDIDTGEVLGMVSSPPFNPNVMVSSRRRNEVQAFQIDPHAPLINRAIKAQVPPGSVFKTVVAVAALGTKTIEPGTSFFCSGAFRLGRQRFRCAHVHGTQNLIEAIAHSCNVYFYNVGLLLGPDPLFKYSKLLGLGERTHIDLPHEEEGSIPSRAWKRSRRNEGWYKGDTLNFSIGQGFVLVTPLQTTRMMANVARSGKVVEPHLIKQIDGQDIIRFATIRTIRLDESIFNIVQTGLRQAVTAPGGTARQLNMAGFEFSGKTGTAQTVPQKPHHAWFVGYNLSGKMRVAFCIYLEHGGSSYYAVRVARDMFSELRMRDVL